jgi:hypothetical protein
MKTRIAIVLFLSLATTNLLGQRPAPPPPCQDEEMMVREYNKTVTELVTTIKKESLQEFDRAYHRKSCLIKLTLWVGTLDGAVNCLDRAAQDRAAAKSQVESYKTKHDSYSKLKEKVAQYRDSLKTTEHSKDAKALIEKFDFSD